MTRLMVLGGGRHQVPLIRRAEEKGVEVVLVDYLADAPGHNVASYAVLADAADPEAALKIAKDYEIDGVITTGTDIPIRSMARVAEALGLPRYIDEDAAHRATHKEAMFESLEAIGVPMARREIVDSGHTPATDHLPVVVKPVDSQGQRGISTVRAAAGMRPALEHAWNSSKTSRAVVEEFLPGPEFTANAWMHDGQVAMLLVNDRITYNPDPFIGIAFQHRYPSLAADNHMNRVAQIADQVADAYGIHQGPLYIQMIATTKGPIVVEAAARVGGGHESRLLFHLNGWRTEDALINLALGNALTAPPRLPDSTHALVNFVLGRSGAVAKVVNSVDSPGVVEMSWYVEAGHELQDVTNSLGRVGYFIAIADDRESLIDLSASYYGILKLPGVNGENLVLTPDEASLNRP